MKNKELFADILIDIALSGAKVTIDKHTNAPVPCGKISCKNCLFGKGCCVINEEKLKSWGEEDATSFWENVEIDTPILVRRKGDSEWLRRHFAYYSQGKIYAFNNGLTSFTSKCSPPSSWDEAKIFVKGMEE